MRTGSTLKQQSKPDSRDSYIALAAILCGAAIALLLLAFSFLGKSSVDYADAAAFGAATTTVWGEDTGHRIHCGDHRDANQCIDGAARRNASNGAALWLGNSQLHAINQFNKGDKTAPMLLHSLLKPKNLDLLTFSQPNANLQEHYLVFEYLATQLRIKSLIIPVVFDDTREDGIRLELAAFANDQQVKQHLTETAVGQVVLRAASSAAVPTDDAGLANTQQAIVERAIDTWLQNHSELWRKRAEMRSWLLNELHLTRNALFGIKPTSKRPLMRPAYNANLAAFEAMLKSAANRGIATVVYIAPIRNDVEKPYVASEYDEFKRRVQELAASYHAKFVNLEDLVPASHWGNTDGTARSSQTEIDFMHFRAAGHRLLAERLYSMVPNALSVSTLSP